MTKMDLITGDFNKGSRRSLCHGKNTWFLIFCTLSVVHYFGPEHSEGNSILWHTLYDRVFKIYNKQDIRNTTVNLDFTQAQIDTRQIRCKGALVWQRWNAVCDVPHRYDTQDEQRCHVPVFEKCFFLFLSVAECRLASCGLSAITSKSFHIYWNYSGSVRGEPHPVLWDGESPREVGGERLRYQVIRLFWIWLLSPHLSSLTLSLRKLPFWQ